MSQMANKSYTNQPVVGVLMRSIETANNFSFLFCFFLFNFVAYTLPDEACKYLLLQKKACVRLTHDLL